MRPVVLASLAGAALVTMAVLVLAAWQDSDRSAQAEGPITVGFDMNPAGNSCPNDGVHDCTLGTIDTCVQVPSGGGVITIDVFLKNLPQAPEGVTGFSGFQYHISERNDLTVGTVAAITHNDANVNLLVQVPPATLFDFSGDVGTSIPFWDAVVGDVSGNTEYNPPFTNGVMSRLQIDTTGAPDGVYGLTIDQPGTQKGLAVLDLEANDYCDPGDPDADPPKTPSPNYIGCDILDAHDGYGLIAVGVDCSAAPPVITPPPTPTPSGPTPTATPTPATPTPSTPTPVPPDLAAGWNYACYLGAALPISEALADIMPSVQAIYHLRPDQGYDKWFPGRPELSTITDLSSYEALFILMANDSAWPQSPADTPPTGLDLTQGWNSACYSGQTKDVSPATASIAGQYEALYLLPTGQSWKRFMPARPEISNLDQLEQFAAVLILVTQSEGANWIFDS